jgi:hypothetical protein
MKLDATGERHKLDTSTLVAEKYNKREGRRPIQLLYTRNRRNVTKNCCSHPY